MAHELLHPLMEDVDFDGIPRWAGEGMAALFEQPRFTIDGDIRGEKNWRWDALVKALRDGDPSAHMEGLFGMSDDVFRGALEDGGMDLAARGMHEATARYLMQWLQDRGGAGDDAWRFYREWRDVAAGDKSGRKAFETVTGRTPEQAEGDWEQWVKGL
jgi:hypothetical protein